MIRITIDVSEGTKGSLCDGENTDPGGLARLSAASASSAQPPGGASALPKTAAPTSTDAALDGGPAPSSVSSTTGPGPNSTSAPVAAPAPADSGGVQDARSAGPAPTFE